MAPTWGLDEPPLEQPRPGPAGWLRVVGRGAALVVVNFGCLALLLILRLFERPLFGAARPLTPWITQFVCRSSLAILGIRYRVEGRPLRGGGAMVANHVSWLDIYALNAATRLYFVSKAEVAGWPGIGWLARATGTVFIARDRAQAAGQVELFRSRLAEGHRLMFFPEGTSTDGKRVLAFKPTLFAAFFDEALRHQLSVQPVSVIYRAPPGVDPRFYGWWGDMAFGPHLLSTLAAPRQGSVTLRYHRPVRVAETADRKDLARITEAAVRDGLEAALEQGPA